MLVPLITVRLIPFATYMARAIVHIVRRETDENRQGIIQGQLNTALNATGLDQAQRVAGALRANPFDMAFSSDLSRAVKVERYVDWLAILD